MHNTTLNIKNILVTGASGVLGADLLPEIRDTYPNATLTTVTRSNIGSFHNANTQHISHDLTSPLSRNAALLEAISQADLIVHLAANVSWILPASDSVEANTTSTRRLLEYCKRHAKNLKRFIHVSTAYVQDRSLSDTTIEPADRNGDFKNNYELSKHMSEVAVEASGLPFAIVRPSLVVGRSDTGYVDSFNGLYFVPRFYCSGHFSLVAGDPNATVDIVTLDKVTQSILAAMNLNNQHKLFWAASFEDAPTVQSIMDTIEDGVNTYRQTHELTPLAPPTFVNMQQWESQIRPSIMQSSPASVRRMISYLDVFVPYFSSTGQFKVSADDYVVPQGVSADQYLPKVIDFWCRNNERTALRNRKTKSSTAKTE